MFPGSTKKHLDTRASQSEISHRAEGTCVDMRRGPGLTPAVTPGQGSTREVTMPTLFHVRWQRPTSGELQFSYSLPAQFKSGTRMKLQLHSLQAISLKTHGLSILTMY